MMIGLTPDGTRLVSASRNPAVAVWNVSRQELVQTLVTDSAPYSVAVSLDGKRVAAGTENGGIFIWDLSRLPAR
jgi:WD40 repeat protein